MRKFSLIFILFALFLCPIYAQAKGNVAEVLKNGQALEKDKKFNQAVDLYKHFLANDSSEEVYKEVCSLLGKLRKYDEAEKMLSEGISKNSNSVSLMNLLGLIRLKRGSVDEARVEWQKVLSIDPKNSFASEWLKKTETKSASNADSVLNDATQPASPGSSKSKLSIEEQEKLALKLYDDMFQTDKWEIDFFITAHTEVVEKCPDTELAQESCWRLSNLYLQAYDKPDFEKIIEILEHLLKTYPDSPFMPDAKNRILTAYQKTGQFDKVVGMYEELFKLNPQLTDTQFMIWNLEYADALVAVGRKDEAKRLYESIVQRDNNQDQLEARVARKRLSSM